jgi:hypothetical protein
MPARQGRAQADIRKAEDNHEMSSAKRHSPLASDNVFG